MTIVTAAPDNTVDMPARLPMSGLTVVVTGIVGNLTREQAQAGVRTLGGVPSGSVSAKTDLVVAGVGAGVSKLGKARNHQTPVVDGSVFAALVTDPSSWDGQPLGAPQDPVTASASEPVAPFTLHRVGKVVCFPTGAREIRLKCTYCHHTWAGTSMHAIPPCPNDTPAAMVGPLSA